MYSAVILFAHEGTWKTVDPPAGSGFQTVPSAIASTLTIQTIHDHILHVSQYQECSKFLGIAYVRDQLPVNTLFIVIYKDNTPIGYIMGKFLPDNGAYLDVICATEGKGGILLNMYIQLCRDTFKVSYIQLSSLMHVLTYYPRLGFSHRKSCAEPPSVAMSPELSKYIVDKLKSGELKSDEAFFEDPKIASFIKELHSHGYTKADTPPSCRDPLLSLGHQKQYKCAKDGYTMMKCLGEFIVPPASHIVPFANYVRTAAPRSTKPSRELRNLLKSASLSSKRQTRKTISKSTGIAGRALRGSRGISSYKPASSTGKPARLSARVNERGEPHKPTRSSARLSTLKHPKQLTYVPLNTIYEQ